MTTELTDTITKEPQRNMSFRRIVQFPVLCLAYIGNLMLDYIGKKLIPEDINHEYDKPSR